MTNGKMNTECNMKTLKIYCDGGFGNRFNALSVGLLIAKVGNFKPVFYGLLLIGVEVYFNLFFLFIL